MTIKRALQVLSAALLILTETSGWVNAETERIRIAVTEFDYNDTSGESREQVAEHTHRLQAFAQTMRDELARSGKYEVVPIACAGNPCSAGTTTPGGLFAAGKNARTKIVLYGGIQKVSTLIQNAKVQAVDVKEDKNVFDKLLTFRGDTNESWAHAEHFLAQEFLSQDFH